MNETQLAPASPQPGATAGDGLRWWTDSVALLFGDVARLGVWIGMALCAFLAHLLLQWIPFLGSIAGFLLWFIFTGGLMLAARKTERGEVPRFADLFSGFGPQGGALAGAGLIILVAMVAVGGLMMVAGLGAMLGGMVNLASLADYQTLSAVALGFGWATLAVLVLCLFLFVPISMAAWLAPALIVLQGANPVDALRRSLSACRANIGALVVYGLTFIGLAIVATIPALLGWFFLLPLMFLSTYSAYRQMLGSVEDIPSAQRR
jgi:uncharacterized membrane protein